MNSKAIVAGVGMIPFHKPGTSDTYDQMGVEAIHLALSDAGIAYSDIQQAYAGYVYGDSTAGQATIYGVGMTGIPVINVNNNCSTGSTALFLARQAIEHDVADCILAVGFEQMAPGAIAEKFTDRPSPFARFEQLCGELVSEDLPLALRYFGGAGREHMDKYGTRMDTFARIRAKASVHAANNPLALLRKVVSVDEVMNDKMLWPGVMTRMMACPPTCGAAAAILVSPDFARRMGIAPTVVIEAQAMTTDRPGTFDGRSMIKLVGADMTREAAWQVYEQAGISPADIDVCELHDCFAHNELITYEGLCFCTEGEGEKFVVDGDNTYGGAVVTNPSGGLLSKGHPLGATGLAQCYELTRQLRGSAGPTQVTGARLALQHNLGLGGACVVTLYGRH